VCKHVGIAFVLVLAGYFRGAIVMASRDCKCVGCHSSTRVDVDSLLQYAHLAQLAYEPHSSDPTCPILQREVQKQWPGTDSLQHVEAANVSIPVQANALVMVTARRLVVAFRGTDSLNTMLTDVNVAASKWNLTSSHGSRVAGAHVHGGFYRSYRALHPKLVPIVFKWLWNRDDRRRAFAREIHLVGHSLGGSLAVLAAAHLASLREIHPHTQLSVVTFGAPRVGDARFVEMFNSLMSERLALRVYTPNDPVVADMEGGAQSILGRLGYKHVGCPVEVDFMHEGSGSLRTSVLDAGMAAYLRRTQIDGQATPRAASDAVVGAGRRLLVAAGRALSDVIDHKFQSVPGGNPRERNSWFSGLLNAVGTSSHEMTSIASGTLRNIVYHSLDEAYIPALGESFHSELRFNMAECKYVLSAAARHSEL